MAVVKQDLLTEDIDVCVLQDLQENIAKKVRKNLTVTLFDIYFYTMNSVKLAF